MSDTSSLFNSTGGEARFPASIANSIRSSQVYWDNAAESYDHDFTVTLIGQLMRRRVWLELDRRFHKGHRVLELNCGTGIDAEHLAHRGVTVTACDVSRNMVEIARRRIDEGHLGARVHLQVLATERLAALQKAGPFDGAFSNFSGLNCIDNLYNVRRDLASVMKPGASALLCMLGRFVPWEIAWYFARGNLRKALRRLLPDNSGSIQRLPPEVHYYSLKAITNAFAPDFRLQNWKGLGIFLPPTYVEHWARRFPTITHALDGADGLVGNIPVLRSMAGFVLLDFQRM